MGLSWGQRLTRWARGLVGLSQTRVSGPYRTTDPALAELMGAGTTSTSGSQVTVSGALSLSAVFAGVNLYSRIVASLPLHVYRKQADGKRAVAADLRVSRLLQTQPNPEMTAVTFRRALEWNRLLGGTAYAEIVWDDDGEAVALWPIEYWRVRQDRDEDGTLFYCVDNTSKVAAKDMLAIPLITADGVTGQSFLDFAVESLGLGITSQEFAGAFFANSARPGGYLHHPNANIDEPTRKAMRASWEKRHLGAKNTNVLGMTWGLWEFKDIEQRSPLDAQLLESRRFQTEEVARWLNLPPILLHDLSKSSWNNVEMQNQFLVQYSIGPVLIDYEQEYDRKLLIPPTVYSKHRVEGFLRGDSKARAEFYKILRELGVLTANDILDLEDMNPIGPLGDLRFVPMNWQSLEVAGRLAKEPAEPKTQPADPDKPDEKPAEDSKGAAVTGDVQATALNGAQIVSLLSIMTSVAADLPAESGKASLRGSFPLMDPEIIDQIIDPIEAWKKNRPAPAPTPAPPARTPEE